MLLPRLKRLLAVCIVPALIVYISILVLSAKIGIKPALVLRDLLQTCEEPMAVGMISSLGYLLWAAAASICLFASISGVVGKLVWRQLLMLGGVFSAVLCFDDLFLLHDRYIGQEFLYISYAIVALIILLRFRQLIVQVDVVSFLVSVLLLGLSILSDKLQLILPVEYSTVQLFEEGFKFIGIACWLVFWSQASRYGIKLQSSPSSHDG